MTFGCVTGSLWDTRGVSSPPLPQHLYNCHSLSICSVKLKKKIKMGAGERAQQLRAVTALPEVLSSNPSNHVVAHNHPQWDSGVSEDSYSVLTYIK